VASGAERRQDDYSGPAPEVMTRSIKHDEPALQMKLIKKGNRGEPIEVKYTTDGKESINKSRHGLEASPVQGEPGYRHTRDFQGPS